MTGFVLDMWIVWGFLAIVALGVKIYSGRLSQNEDDQLILDDAFSHLKTEQAAIIARVNKLAPIKNASLWLFVAASVFVVGYYVLDIINQFKGN
jgi:hypothetical protein